MPVKPLLFKVWLPVGVPTFVLVNVYRRTDAERLYHMDAYRISGPDEAIDLDLDDMLDQGPLIVEWADRIDAALAEARLWVTLNWVDETQRDIVFRAFGAEYEGLLQKFREEVYGAA